jgi:threonine dehydratase
VELRGDTYDEAEAHSVAVASERNLTYVHPFDDPAVIAGQGTIGLELIEQVPAARTVIVPLSGGGLIGGVAAALEARTEPPRVVGVSAENARVMYESIRAGRPIAFPEEPTVASALSGGIGLENRYTFELVEQLVDQHVVVPEPDIHHAVAFLARDHKLVVEGGGAVGVAALLSGLVEGDGGDTVTIVSGGNIDLPVLADILAGTDTELRA